MDKNIVHAPKYIDDFKCIADRCQDSCCIGWEIDIDKQTLDKYNKIKGDFGKKLKSNIEYSYCPHFKLLDNGRCPFLNSHNLCDVIINLGESYLSEICTKHPRFYNEYAGFEEYGVGLCCEEGARLLLTSDLSYIRIDYLHRETKNLPFELISFLDLRSCLFDIICEKSDTVIGLSLKLLEKSCSDLDFSKEEFECGTEDFADILYRSFSELEVMDDEFSPLFNKGLKAFRRDEKGFIEFLENVFSDYFRKLLCYFIYRHTFSSFLDFSLMERVAFSVVSSLVISIISFGDFDCTLGTVSNYSRVYSKNVEYSTDNSEMLIEGLCGEKFFSIYNHLRSQQS